MSDRFGNLNKYERAYLRSQLRRQRKRKPNLRTRKTFWSFLRDFFTPTKKNRKTRSKTINVVAQTKKIVSQDSQKEKQHQLIQGMNTKVRKKVQQKVTKNKSNKQPKKGKIILKNILFLFGTIALLGLIVFGFWFTSLEIPDVSNFQQRKISNSTKIYDKTGEIILYDIHENIQRTVVGFEDINQYAKDAIVAIEDHTFYEHKGVVVSSTLRAVAQTLFSRIGLSRGGTAGGSTLTQQVVKNTLLNSKRLVSRKVKEWVLAYKIEQQLSKDEILEIYLNEAPYGGTIYGIEEASREFFGTPSSELTLGQSAYLAAIPNLPTFYSPYGPNKDKLDQRQKTVLREMRRYGYISDNQYREALQEEVEFLSQEENAVKALHFVQYVRSYLEQQYGHDVVENGGLKVVTTLDYKLQKKAEDILKSHIQEVEEDFDASNAALVAVEPKTGHIITMVGSRDYFDDEIDGNFNVALARRQPGSSFKPIAYANAFEKGYLPETAIFDTKTQFNSSCDPDDLTSNDGCYSPTNFDNEFNGPMTIKNALAQSRNIPAVKMLYLGGVAETMKLAQNMGINTLNEHPSFYGLGLVLGGGEVTLLELTGAYGAFANEGDFNKPTGVLSVEDSEGNILEKYQNNEKRVLSPNSARMISDILSDNAARTPLFGSQSFMYFGDTDVAGKTGTTNDNRDAWLVGFTPELAVGVWTGNNDNSPMKKGSSISGKPWRSYMDEALKEYEKEEFNAYELPTSFQQLPAMLRGQWEGSRSVGLLVDGSPRVWFDPHTILHFIEKSDPYTQKISTSDSQYENWEYSVQLYAQENFEDLYDANDELPTEVDDVDSGSQGDFELRIRGIDDEDEFELDESDKVSVGFRDIDIDDIQKVDFFINGSFVDSDEAPPFNTELDFGSIPGLEFENILKVVATSDDASRVSEDLTFFIVDHRDHGGDFQFTEIQDENIEVFNAD